MRANTVFQQTPGLSLLTQDQCEEIHLAVLEVLDRVGVNVFEDEALSLLQQAGARVDGSRVHIPSWLVKKALSTVPCRVAISNRKSQRAMLLEKGRSYFGTGSDTQFTYDVEYGERRLAVKRDVASAARIADALPNIDFVMSLGIASDVPAENSYVHQFEAMVLNTTKPILYTAANQQDVEDILSIAELVAGDRKALAADPFLVLYAQPSTPLQHSREALEKLLLCAERRVPFQYISAVMLGGTAPVTMAGALVLVTAESLSGLVIHQLKSPGAPFISGGAAPQMDMQTSLCSYGAPELQLSCAAMAAMGRYYNLPVFTTAGCSDAQSFDQQAGMEAGYSVLMQALAGSNLIHDLGYIGAGMTSSMEMLALCNETAGIVKYILRGVEISPETLALDVIERVGPGGNFLAEEHTVEHFRTCLHFSELQNRLEYALWKEQGAEDFAARANQGIREILENHRVPELPEEIVENVKAITRRRDGEAASSK